MFVPVLILLTTFFTLPTSAQSKSRTVNPDLNASLKKQATNFDRYGYLSQDTDWQYDFSQHPNYNSQTGAVIVADAASFPALTEQGMTISLLKLAGCGMLAPHLHPRATNLVVAITGNTTTYMAGENGVRTVVTELTSMKMTIFPKGSVHSMQNNDCEPAMLISALNSEDTGTLNIVNALWTMPEDIVRAAFGNAGMDKQDTGKNIPAVGTGAIIGSAECKKRCGIKD